MRGKRVLIFTCELSVSRIVGLFDPEDESNP
jgi:hypothetical protein